MARTLRLLVVAAVALGVAIMHAGIGSGHSHGGHASMPAAAMGTAAQHSAGGAGHDPGPTPGSPCDPGGQVCVSTPVSPTLAGVDLLAVLVLALVRAPAAGRPTTLLPVPRRRWRSPPRLSALCVWRI